MNRTLRIVARRAIAAVPTILIVALVCFALLEAAPGDAVDAYLAQTGGGDAGFAAELREDSPASARSRRRAFAPPASTTQLVTRPTPPGSRPPPASLRNPPASVRVPSSSLPSFGPAPSHDDDPPTSVMPRVTLAEAVRRSLEPGPEHDPRPRLLLVEDNAVNQRVGRVMAEKRGYQVDVASNGLEAINAVLRGGYVAVLMDCQMPKLDGYSATAEIRRREVGSRTPIIAMTADAGPGAREKCLAAGMDDYLSKPMSADELDRLLHAWAPIPGSVRARGRHDEPADEGPPSSSRAHDPSIVRAPAVDPAALASLRAMRQGDSDLVLEVIELFLQETPPRLAALRDGLRHGDLPLVIRVAHTLRGSAGYLGAKTLTALCARVEDKARQAQPFNAAFALSSIEEEVERVCSALLAEVERLRASGIR